MKTFNFLMMTFLACLLQPLDGYANHHHHHSNGILPTRQELSDTAVTAKVKSKLLTDSATSGTNMSVRTDDHVVSLSGTAKSEAEKKLAEDIAANTNGVKSVNNQLEVK